MQNNYKCHENDIRESNCQNNCSDYEMYGGKWIRICLSGKRMETYFIKPLCIFNDTKNERWKLNKLREMNWNGR